MTTHLENLEKPGNSNGRGEDISYCAGRGNARVSCRSAYTGAWHVMAVLSACWACNLYRVLPGLNSDLSSLKSCHVVSCCGARSFRTSAAEGVVRGNAGVLLPTGTVNGQTPTLCIAPSDIFRLYLFSRLPAQPCCQYCEWLWPTSDVICRNDKRRTADAASALCGGILLGMLFHFQPWPLSAATTFRRTAWTAKFANLIFGNSFAYWRPSSLF